MKLLTKLPGVAALLLAGALFAFADDDDRKIAPDLKKWTGGSGSGSPGSGSSGSGSSSNEFVNVIIQFRTPPTADKLRWLGSFGSVKRIRRGQKAIPMRLPAGVVRHLLKSDKSIFYVSPDRPMARLLDYSTATTAANIAWSFGYTGKGVGVAVIDSGVNQADDDLVGSDGKSRVVYSESFVAGETPHDNYGHGTHVAGIVGSNAADSSGAGRSFKGVAPDANIINLKVLSKYGAGAESDVIAAIYRAIELKDTYNIRVMNLSLGRPVFESYALDPLCQAVEDAWKAGIVVVTSAGNYGRHQTTNGYGTIVSPGNSPFVITVGAMKANATTYKYDDAIASYSSKGPTAIDHFVKPDLVAPGNRVVSLLSPSCTLALNYPKTLIEITTYDSSGSGKSPDYFRLSGTSMAAPVVAGAAALMIQKDPSLTPDQVKARMMKTATKTLLLFSEAFDNWGKSFRNQSDIFTVGAGYLDIQGALNNNDKVFRPALSPKAVRDSAARKVHILFGNSVVWGDSVIWGDSVVWGDSTTEGFSVIWGDSVVWGDNTLVAFSASEDEQ